MRKFHRRVILAAIFALCLINLYVGYIQSKDWMVAAGAIGTVYMLWRVARSSRTGREEVGPGGALVSLIFVIPDRQVDRDAGDYRIFPLVLGADVIRTRIYQRHAERDVGYEFLLRQLNGVLRLGDLELQCLEFGVRVLEPGNQLFVAGFDILFGDTPGLGEFHIYRAVESGVQLGDDRFLHVNQLPQPVIKLPQFDLGFEEIGIVSGADLVFCLNDLFEVGEKV